MSDRNKTRGGQGRSRNREENRSIGNQQGTTQTGGTNQKGQSPDINKGERSRDHGHERAKKGR